MNTRLSREENLVQSVHIPTIVTQDEGEGWIEKGEKIECKFLLQFI